MVPPKNNQAPKKSSKEGKPWAPRPNGDYAPSGPSVGPKHDPKVPASSKKKGDDTSFAGTGEIKILDHLASSFELASQVPGLKLEVDGYVIVLNVHNFLLKNVEAVFPPIEDCIFKECILGGGEATLSVDGILSAFANELDTSGLTVKQAENLLKFAGGDPQAKGDDAVNQKGGFCALNFTLKGRISPPRINLAPKSCKDTRALEIQRMLKKGQFNFTLGRSLFTTGIVADPQWPYKGDFRPTIQSAAVIHDIAASVKFNEKYYNWDRTYEAIVSYVKKDYVQLEFDISSRGGLTFPSINGGTLFLVRYGQFITAEDSNTEIEHDKDKIEKGKVPEEEENEATTGATNINSSQENIDTNVIDKGKGEQGIYVSSEDEVAVRDVAIDRVNNIEWTAQVLVAKENIQFVTSFIIPKGKKRKFHVGSKVNVQLKVLSNHLNTVRQLKAIGMIAEDKAKDDTYGRILQRFILGEGMADVRDDIEDHLLSLKAITYNQLPLLNQKVYDQWLENCSLNLMQREAYDAVIEDVLPATIIQGQSGTARSLTSAVTCATQKLFEAVDNEKIGVNSAPRIVAEVKESIEKFRIIHFPANASTENDFMKRDDERRDGEEDDPLEAYRISNHVIKSFHRKANDSELSNTVRNKAGNWLAMLQRVREGKSVPAERFVKEGIDEIQDVVRDAHTKIIVSTCNNSAPLREMKFKPHVVMVDDASSAREPDCIIPLTFDQAHTVLYGDSNQKLVVPAVRSSGNNEFSAQLSRSLFERLVGQGNIKVVQLE
ncbi:hypothetical protein BOTCAL_0288g00220 [Botryotinia calthae]|uniref:DNA2/NAM7 helicase helicase domain-containing protein n=1 Tax=Botryotinia calthae TaxID=38488 RepID=A0A4Y8CUX9_9HELO|nr:hypothetical protein BOTCAL_0288g00220 [Botryotinia calthae]